jgi:hypothetical protein
MLKKFFKDGLIYTLPGIFTRGISFFLVPLYTRVLSPADEGYFDLVMAFGGLIYLPNSADVPDGYIVIIKAINIKPPMSPNVTIGVNGPTITTTGDPFDFTLNYQSVIYRYDKTANHWDLIAKN